MRNRVRRMGKMLILVVFGELWDTRKWNLDFGIHFGFTR